MAYFFKRSDVSVEVGVKRIALEQVKKAIAEIDDESLSPDETVHQIRKRCKKLRALLRLVRGSFENRAAENALFRDAAAGLSSARDAAVVLSTYDSLRTPTGGDVRVENANMIRAELFRYQHQAASDDVLDARLSAFRDAMAAATERIPAWTLEKDGFDALAGGLKKTCKRTRRAMARASEERNAVNFHAWRKRVKDHWYHTRLLHPIRPSMLNPHRKNARNLSKLLGEHHDLAVLEAWLLDDPEKFASTEELVPLIGRIEKRRTALENEALALGEELLKAKPKALVREWRHYWEKWKAE